MEKKEKTVKKTDKVKETKENAKVEKVTSEVKKTKPKKATKIKFETAEQAEVKKFFVVILVVLICVGGIYLFTRAFVSKDLFKKDEPKTEEVVDGEVNYDVTIMGQILNRPYDEYYVLIYNQSEGEYMGEMANIRYEYDNKEDDKKIHMYSVDLANELNKSYYDKDNENTKAKTLDEIKVGDKTLLKIKKNKKSGKLEVSKYITDIDEMKKELKIEEDED